jgi:ribosomal protein S18 acetylase RimI-like enzyme
MTETAIVIRRAGAADIPALGTIYRAAWIGAYSGIVPAESIKRVTAHPDAELSASIAGERPGLFVAEAADGEVVGWVRLQGTLIKSLHVDPARQGTGIGRKLLDHGAAVIGPRAFLICLAENRAARDFYVRRGWREDSPTFEPIDGVNYPAIRYVAPPGAPSHR